MAMILPSVAPTAQPMQQFAAPEYKNVPAAQMQQTGEAMMKAGVVIHRVVQDINDNIDTANAQAAHNKLMAAGNTVLNDPENGFVFKTGKNAVDARSGALTSLQDARKEISQTLTNDMQRFLFNRAADATMQSWQGKIDVHTGQQTKIWRIGEATAGMDNHRQLASADIDNFGKPGSDFQKHKDATIALAEQVADLQGFDKEQRDKLVTAETTKLHADGINLLLTDTNKAGMALDYFRQHEKEIAVDQRDNLKAKIEDKVAFVKGSGLGSKIYSDLAPKDINESIKSAESKMLAEIDKSGADEHTKNYAKKAVKDQVEQYNDMKRGNAENAGNDLYGYMNSKGATYGTSINMVNQWEKAGKIDHKDAEALRDAADRKFRISEGRAEAKQAQNLKYLSNFLTFQNDYANGLLGKLDPSQVAKRMKDFGPFTDNAMQFVNHANNSADDVKLSMDKLKEELRVMKQNPAFKELKTIPNPDSNGEEDKASLALLNQKVIARIAASGKAGPGKQMTVQQALSEELKPVVTGKGIFWDDKAPRYKLGTTAADDPKKWTKEAKTAFINDSFYRKNGRYPTPYEATVFMHQLDK